ncbi:hypothetical protein JZ751_025280 [Albula glossodonta]|uniref:Uncharacterized protein n=1 Tax=Albula glossodonta TaxID=121402 RepID=A0A8T2NIP6_9TELE|nr:hypothetical protein JZ751_025280 [Albula glossodonta]
MFSVYTENTPELRKLYFPESRLVGGPPACRHEPISLTGTHSSPATPPAQPLHGRLSQLTLSRQPLSSLSITHVHLSETALVGDRLEGERHAGSKLPTGRGLADWLRVCALTSYCWGYVREKGSGRTTTHFFFSKDFTSSTRLSFVQLGAGEQPLPAHELHLQVQPSGPPSTSSSHSSTTSDFTASMSMSTPAPASSSTSDAVIAAPPAVLMWHMHGLVTLVGDRHGTSVLLQHPALELDDGVGEGAAVLPLAAIAHLVSAHVELAQGVQGPHLAVAHVC